MISLRKTVFFLLSGLLLWPLATPARADAELPYVVQTALVTKLLRYDVTLDDYIGDGPLVIGLLHGDDQRSRATLKGLGDELSRLKRKGIRIAGHDFDVRPVSASDAGELAARIRENGISVLFVIGGRCDMKTVTTVTQELKVLTVTGFDADRRVADGVTVGLAMRNSRPSIIVNIVSARKEGRSFAPHFLSLVTVKS